MMHYVQAFDRDQFMMTTWDSMVDPESTARLIDAFVDSLDLSDYGVKELASEGRPPYDPKGFLNCMSMEAITESSLYESLLKAAR